MNPVGLRPNSLCKDQSFNSPELPPNKFNLASSLLPGGFEGIIGSGNQIHLGHFPRTCVWVHPHGIIETKDRTLIVPRECLQLPNFSCTLEDILLTDKSRVLRVLIEGYSEPLSEIVVKRMIRRGIPLDNLMQELCLRLKDHSNYTISLAELQLLFPSFVDVPSFERTSKSTFDLVRTMLREKEIPSCQQFSQFESFVEFLETFSPVIIPTRGDPGYLTDIERIAISLPDDQGDENQFKERLQRILIKCPEVTSFEIHRKGRAVLLSKNCIEIFLANRESSALELGEPVFCCVNGIMREIPYEFFLCGLTTLSLHGRNGALRRDGAPDQPWFLEVPREYPEVLDWALELFNTNDLEELLTDWTFEQVCWLEPFLQMYSTDSPLHQKAIEIKKKFQTAILPSDLTNVVEIREWLHANKNIDRIQISDQPPQILSRRAFRSLDIAFHSSFMASWREENLIAGWSELVNCCLQEENYQKWLLDSVQEYLNELQTVTLSLEELAYCWENMVCTEVVVIGCDKVWNRRQISAILSSNVTLDDLNQPDETIRFKDNHVFRAPPVLINALIPSKKARAQLPDMDSDTFQRVWDFEYEGRDPRWPTEEKGRVVPRDWYEFLAIHRFYVDYCPHLQAQFEQEVLLPIELSTWKYYSIRPPNIINHKLKNKIKVVLPDYSDSSLDRFWQGHLKFRFMKTQFTEETKRNLKSLWISGPFNFLELPNLTSLRLADWDLGQADLQELVNRYPGLTDLEIAADNIESFDCLAGLTRLRCLRIKNYKGQTLRLGSVSKLYLWSCEVHSLKTDGLPNLDKVSYHISSKNNTCHPEPLLVGLNVGRLKEIRVKEERCTRRILSLADSLYFPHLEKLILIGVEFEEVPTIYAPNLQDLNIKGNWLPQIEGPLRRIRLTIGGEQRWEAAKKFSKYVRHLTIRKLDLGSCIANYPYLETVKFQDSFFSCKRMSFENLPHIKQIQGYVFIEQQKSCPSLGEDIRWNADWRLELPDQKIQEPVPPAINQVMSQLEPIAPVLVFEPNVEQPPALQERMVHGSRSRRVKWIRNVKGLAGELYDRVSRVWRRTPKWVLPLAIVGIGVGVYFLSPRLRTLFQAIMRLAGSRLSRV